MRRRLFAWLCLVTSVFIWPWPNSSAPDVAPENSNSESGPPVEPLFSLLLELEGALPNGAAGLRCPDMEEREVALAPEMSWPVETPVQCVVWIRAEGFARYEVTMPVGPGLRHVAALEEPEPIRGVVLGPDRTPLAGVDVQCRLPGYSHVWESQTNELGVFGWSDSPAGAFTLRLRAEGYAEIRMSQVSRDPVTLTMEVVSVVRGRVVGENEAPRADASVVLAGSGIWPPRRVQTDASGTFEFLAIPEGIYELRAHHGSDFARVPSFFELEPGQTQRYDLVLRTGGTLRGRVVTARDASGVDGARLSFSRGGLDVAPRDVRTDAEGGFSLEGLAQEALTVRITAEGYVPLSTTAAPPFEAVRWVLAETASLSGRVVDPQGSPVVGAQIAVDGHAQDQSPIRVRRRSARLRELLQRAEGHHGGLPPLPVQAGPVPPISAAMPLDVAYEPTLAADHMAMETAWQTDDEGRFSIPHVPPGRVQLYVTKPGFAPRLSPRFELRPGESRDAVELVMQSAGRVRVSVHNSEGEPLQGVMVDIRSAAAESRMFGFTDAQGEWEGMDVAGMLTITARPEGLPVVRARRRVEPGEATRVRLRVPATSHSLAGRVLDAAGFPIGGAHLGLRALDPSTPQRAQGTSRADGTFVFEGRVAPPWWLQVEGDGRARVSLRVDDASAEVEVRLGAGTVLAGRVVRDFTGEGLAATLTCTHQDAPPRAIRVRSDADGRFEIPEFFAGTWVLAIRAPGYVPVMRTLTFEEAEVVDGDLRLPRIGLVRAGGLSGTVVDQLGIPVEEALVEVQIDDRWRDTRTDSVGRFALADLGAGTAWLHARHRSAGESTPVEVMIRSGSTTPDVVAHLPGRIPPGYRLDLESSYQGVNLVLREDAEGVVVSRVPNASPAAEAGLVAGDRLVSIDQVSVTSLAEARERLQGPRGITATLGVVRGADETFVFVARE